MQTRPLHVPRVLLEPTAIRLMGSNVPLVLLAPTAQVRAKPQMQHAWHARQTRIQPQDPHNVQHAHLGPQV